MNLEGGKASKSKNLSWLESGSIGLGLEAKQTPIPPIPTSNFLSLPFFSFISANQTACFIPVNLIFFSETI